jgi:ring-1,2-phenylacetyl-CoA epoxidase subunit PaaC
MVLLLDQRNIKAAWDKTINEVLDRATLQRPKDAYMHSGRLNAIHSEYLGHLLAEMQFLPRAYPDAKW